VNFKVVVENVNDVMEDPRITNPGDGDKFKANYSFLLSAFCSDPDTQHGQVLNYSWTSNASGLIGYGPSLTVRLLEVGVHVITLTVTDGEFEKMTSIGIIIEEVDDGPHKPQDGDGDDSKGFPTGLLLAVLVILGVMAMSVFFVVSKARREREEAEEEAAFAAEEERVKALEKARMTVKRAADQLEVERGTVDIASKEGGVETEALEEVELTSLGVPETTLSIEAKKTAAPSADVQALFDDMEKEEPAVSEEEIETMRLDNLKRKYQNAIGRLPYGIPSEELKGMDWVDLAAALATGEKKPSPDGIEITAIEGRWYYSDDKDSSTFLKEHGAKPKAPAKKAKVTTDKEDLLAKLEERFILGEISEKAYEELKRKYGG
jgi:type II secretory pathway pseudopilin PulG